MEVLKCDFCSAPAPTWSYPCQTFVVREPDLGMNQSVGDWAACQECHELVQSVNFPGLAHRSLIMLVESTPEITKHVTVKILRRYLTSLHNQFLENRLGPAVRIVK